MVYFTINSFPHWEHILLYILCSLFFKEFEIFNLVLFEIIRNLLLYSTEQWQLQNLLNLLEKSNFLPQFIQKLGLSLYLDISFSLYLFLNASPVISEYLSYPINDVYNKISLSIDLEFWFI